MKWRTKGDKALHFGGYTITPGGTEIDNEAVNQQLADHPLFISGAKQKKAKSADVQHDL